MALPARLLVSLLGFGAEGVVLCPGDTHAHTCHPLTYHFHTSTCGAQLLVSDQRGVVLVPPSLQGERERQREARSRGGKEVGKGWRGGRNNSYFCHKTEMNTLVPAMPRMDIRLRQGLDRRG